jgi:hypothetical protein
MIAGPASPGAVRCVASGEMAFATRSWRPRASFGWQPGRGPVGGSSTEFAETFGCTFYKEFTVSFVAVQQAEAKYDGMPGARSTPMSAKRLPRDPRVDVLRGIALVMIFIDHVPGNLLSLVTLRNFGFADAAELFVLLAGFASMAAYGGSFSRDGVVSGLRRVVLRCLHLYLYQALMLVTVLVLADVWMRNFGSIPDNDASFAGSGLSGLRHGLTLQALPASLNILPLYMVLLALFPLIYGLITISPLMALFASGALWLGVNLRPSINLPNWLDGQNWFFDPFAWQLLFVLGALGALMLRRNNGNLPSPPWLRGLAWGYLGFALIAMAPWDSWGWTSLRLLPVELPDKTTLAPLRLLNVMALAILVFGSPWLRQVADRRELRFLLVCGRHSLEVFSLGTILAMVFRLMFNSFGVTMTTQVFANSVGIGLMIALAMALEHARHAELRVPVNGNSVASRPGA